ncbi:MAG: hypothetical protein ACD_2C00208G0014 [uncultured bacterium (gcode 4)]|uniref:Prepilin-type N-terminal cleavage/methylation domain-containing protein n=1 Tax=uncultured bacterium (gcode 4) TaxID=1234023 RepID=K2G1Z4_9BACT|nr:MAG: hypothetical protein ACD_2C00208G0014 [uncultured bacterium (gcode 4)]
MRTSSLKAFTIVELLVVITILAIISVVAYTNFWWSTDKAKNSKRLSDVASIETWLQAFYQEKNYYPMPSQYSAATPKNLWGYNNAVNAQLSNTLSWAKSWDQFTSIIIASTLGWWKVNDTAWAQVWAKWTIDKDVLTKAYLSTELLDPGLKDVKVGDTESFKDYWIWEYVYWVYAKSNTTWTSASQKWSAYNIAVTMKDDQKWFVTKLIWNFDKSTCATCPSSLVWPGWAALSSLNDWDSSQTWSSTNPTETIPYAIIGF